MYARTIPDPRLPDLASTRTSAILDYGDEVRCSMTINHNHPYGEAHEAATIKIDGEKGSAVTVMGVLLNYPQGKPDVLEIITEGNAWTAVPLLGRWFPDAFAGTMSNLQRFAAGEDDRLATMLFEEDVCTFHVLLLDPFDFTRIGLGAHTVTDPVVNGIPRDCSDGK